MAVPLDVLDPPDVGAVVQPDSPAQDAAGDAPNPVPHVGLGTDLDAVVAVDERDVLDRVVAALEMERPGIGVNVVGLLVGVEDGQPLDRGGIAHLEQGGCILLVPPAGGEDDGADQRFDVDRSLIGADQGHAHGDLEAASHQILACRESDHATLLARRIQGLLDGGRVVGLAIRFGSEGHHIERPDRRCWCLPRRCGNKHRAGTWLSSPSMIQF